METLVEGSTTGHSVRVLVAGAWGFASGQHLHGLVEKAVRLAGIQGGRDAKLADAPVLQKQVHWVPRIDPEDIPVEEKCDLLRDLEKAVREHQQIRSVETAYSHARINKTYCNSEGTDLAWSLPRIVAQAFFTARDGDVASRSTRVGATKGWEAFADEDPIEKARLSSTATVASLGAKAAKGGKTTVVLDHELAGVFAHEAVGHAAEADLVSAGESCFKGRIGERLGIEGLTIHDDPRLPGAFGSYPFDDNGVAAEDKVLVRDGILAGFMADREHAGNLNIRPNGAARAEDYRSRPLVRMSNTLIDAGEQSEEEVFSGIKEGVFCKGSRGGQVDTARGTYLFNAQEAYRIVDGEIREPLRDVSLTGSIMETLHTIDALGDTFALGDPGYCGKGQWVPVCDGGPLVRIRDCLVGGA